MRRYCDMGATCTIIDHTGKKGGKEPIGTTAKMTQMDTAHFFSVREKTMSLDGRSFSCVIRVENFLKRFAPEGVGTFSMLVKATVNANGEWHTTNVEAIKDISVRKVEKKVRWLQEVIDQNPKAGQNDLGKLAAKRTENGSKLLGEKQAIQLLKEGSGKYSRMIPQGKDNKKVFRVIKEEVSLGFRPLPGFLAPFPYSARKTREIIVSTSCTAYLTSGIDSLGVSENDEIYPLPDA